MFSAVSFDSASVARRPLVALQETLMPARGKRQRDLKRWAMEVRRKEKQLADITDDQLTNRARRERDQRTRDHEMHSTTDFAALVAEAVFRVFRFRLHNVQLHAIAAGIDGTIVQMQTGEGKTLVTGAVAAIKTLSVPTVHVGTTNMYLAARDLEGLHGVFDLLDLTYGLLPEQSNEAESRRVYRKQIVYGPGYQFGFDYLRDQMNLRRERGTQLGAATANRIRGADPYNPLQPTHHHIALIDEADSVMIDEAMTPLVISLPASDPEDPVPYKLAKQIANRFQEGSDYKIEMPHKQVEVQDAANQRAHDAVADRRLQLARPWRTYIRNAIRAQHVLQRDVDYVVDEGKVKIVDQYTGRIFDDRTWQDGLHQAVEEKESVSIQQGRESTTQISRQRYLQMYDHLTGLTGTAMSVAGEFLAVYGCPVVEIPTDRKCIRTLERTRFFASAETKAAAIANDVAARHRAGQPVLVGTKTIQESFAIRDALLAEGLDPVVLNGVQDEEEADIVAAAGISGTITIATNMAGRGTDIKPDSDALKAGGLHVVGASPNASARIDRQLVGRAARQGQPGSAQFFASACDTIFTDDNPSLARTIERRSRRSGESGNFTRELSALQQTIEGRNFRQRQEMILRDNWMDQVREAIEKQ